MLRPAWSVAVLLGEPEGGLPLEVIWPSSDVLNWRVLSFYLPFAQRFSIPAHKPNAVQSIFPAHTRPGAEKDFGRSGPFCGLRRFSLCKKMAAGASERVQGSGGLFRFPAWGKGKGTKSARTKKAERPAARSITGRPVQRGTNEGHRTCWAGAVRVCLKKLCCRNSLPINRSDRRGHRRPCTSDRTRRRKRRSCRGWEDTRP